MNARQMPKGLTALQFDNRFLRELPVDPVSSNIPRQVIGYCASRVLPAQVRRPQLVAYAQEVADLLDLSAKECQSEAFAQVFSGNSQLPGMDPYASCYGGHQFGNWAGQLGDGRAINLGEVVNRQGQRLGLQLKGSGPTPYSRSADGLAVLRSSVREFLCSEAMHHLGVPTTRALSLTLTGEQVWRDMFYDGRTQQEPGAVVCRVAPSFIRFGNFQLLAARGQTELLRQLADYCIRTDFPHLGEPSPEVYRLWFEEICRTTADMVLHWMRVGFVHGVMNTDNMSILGLTIDYGPYGWLEDYNPNWTPNTTDAGGRRYRYAQQPQIALWNLAQLANTLYSLFDETKPLEQALDGYKTYYQQGRQTMMLQKLGLTELDPEADDALVTELLEVLQLAETDMTRFYRLLADLKVETADSDASSDATLIAPLLDAYYLPESLTSEQQARIGSWLRLYGERVRREGTPDTTRRQRMNAVNPNYVLRNYLAQLAIDKAEQQDFSLVNELLEVLRHPYDDLPSKEEFARKRPDWARNRAGCSMLSCSS
ncbi:MAG: hypothetical protein ACJAWL_002010 [Motiliproteus sp.]|jgi:uncharacterized protein YdiU (UPF0061 family)